MTAKSLNNLLLLTFVFLLFSADSALAQTKQKPTKEDLFNAESLAKLPTINKFVKSEQDIEELPEEAHASLIIWLPVNRHPDYVKPVGGDERELARIEEQKAEYRSYLSALKKPIIESADKDDLVLTYSSKYAPLFAVRGYKKNLKSFLEKNKSKNLGLIYLSTKAEAKPGQVSALETSRIDWLLDTDGSGVKVGLVELNGPATDLPDSQYLDVTARRNNCEDGNGGEFGQHALAVGGVVASTKSGLGGGATGVEIYASPTYIWPDCNSSTDEEFFEAIDWAIDQDVDIINMSFYQSTRMIFESTPLIYDVYVDYLALYEWVTFVASAGNEKQNFPETHYVEWKYYNGLVVGAINDHDTSDWSDDSLAWFSSWRNPSEAGRELPHVAATGYPMSLLGLSGTNNYGTSFSTPIVTAHAARIIDYACYWNWDCSLNIWPEAIRAIICAGAVNRNRETPGWQTGREENDDFQIGCGAVSGQHEEYILSSWWWFPDAGYDRGTIYESDYDENGNYSEGDWYFYAEEGDTIRVAFATDSRSTCSSYENCPSSDYVKNAFNIKLYRDGELIANTGIPVSHSNGETLKLLELNDVQEGEYNIEVNRWYHVSGYDYEYFGLAWLTY